MPSEVAYIPWIRLAAGDALLLTASEPSVALRRTSRILLAMPSEESANVKNHRS